MGITCWACVRLRWRCLTASLPSLTSAATGPAARANLRLQLCGLVSRLKEEKDMHFEMAWLLLSNPLLYYCSSSQLVDGVSGLVLID